MKKSIAVFLLTVLMLMVLSSACGKAPATDTELTAVPTVERSEESSEMLLVNPPDSLILGFDSYEELAVAVLDSSTSGYSELRTAPNSAESRSALGTIYNSFVDGLEKGKLSFPLPAFNGELAKLAPDINGAVSIFSNEKFNLPCVWYNVNYDGINATVEVFPLSLANEIKLTGSETYSDISKKLAPLYLTEDTPKEQYSEYCSSVTARELELAEGRRVWATILEETPYDNDYRESYRFLYDGFIVNIWKWNKLNDPSDRLTDDFFKAFSLGGDLTSLYKQA